MLDLVIYTSIKSAPEHLICLVLAASVTALTNRTYLRCQSGVKSFLKMLMYQKRTLRFFESFCLALTASKNGFYNLSVIQFDDTVCGSRSVCPARVASVVGMQAILHIYSCALTFALRLQTVFSNKA